MKMVQEDSVQNRPFIYLAYTCSALSLESGTIFPENQGTTHFCLKII